MSDTCGTILHQTHPVICTHDGDEHTARWDRWSSRRTQDASVSPVGTGEERRRRSDSRPACVAGLKRSDELQPSSLL